MKSALSVVEPFAAVLGGAVASLPVPLWVPWPVPAGWSFAGFAHDGVGSGQTTTATAACWGGSDPFGDPIEVVFVSEDPGAGVGGRFAGLRTSYPTTGVGEGPPHARLEIDGHTVELWEVGAAMDRSAFVGSAAGRWLWTVVHPAEASAIMVEPFRLVDARRLGAELQLLPIRELSPRLVLEATMEPDDEP